MAIDVLAEAEAVAAARWAATEPRVGSPTPTIPRHAAAAPPADGGWGALAGSQCRLYDLTGHLVSCPVCGQADGWRAHEDPIRRRFVCEHPPVELVFGWVRQIATVSLQQLTRWEAIEPAP